MLPACFDAASRLWADRIAIEVPPGRGRPARVRVTYAALAARAEAIAALVGDRLPADTTIALFLPRTSPDAYAAQLAVLAAGGAYVAFDWSFPNARLAAIVADAAPAAVLTDTAGAARLATLGLAPRVLNLDHIAEAATQPPVRPDIHPNQLAYVIYTSGTTGRPKGVLVEHAAIANLVVGDVDEFRLDGADRVAQGSSHAYDSSIEEIWLALAAGATLVVMDDDVVRAGPDLPTWLRTERITVLCPPPTLLRMMTPRAAATLPDLRLIYAGGEALTPDLVAAWAPGRRVVNGYRPTECAVTAIRGDVTPGVPVTIGRPAPGVRAWVLDESLQEVPDDTRGELCLGGAGLARGYHNAPADTAARFVMHPIFGRLYRTGDLAHREADGRLYCHGRIDAQVKLRGYRIELEEIDTHLSRLAGVRAGACRISGPAARPQLVAYLVAEPETPPASSEDLRAALADALPPYMIPGAFRWIEALPTTTGGKLDRAALPDVDGERDDETDERVEVGTTTESAVERALRRALARDQPISIDADFFADLSGDSLLAADFTTLLREEPVAVGATVRDVYEAPTVRRLAARLDAARPGARPGSDDTAAVGPGARSDWAIRAATAAQGAWLLVLLAAAHVAGYGAFVLMAAVVRDQPLSRLILAAPMIAPALFAGYVLVTYAALWIAKWAVIGRYRAARIPLWSPAHVRHWIVCTMAAAVPWSVLAGTGLLSIALRGLGARVGRRVHMHRGVDLRQGGWDLLTIGDDVTVDADAELRLVDFDAQQLVVGPITIGDGATIATRAGLSAHTRMDAGAYLTPLSDLAAGCVIPANAAWSGVPAQPSGPAPEPPLMPGARAWSEATWTLVLLALESFTWMFVVAPAVILATALVWTSGWSGGDLVDAVSTLSFDVDSVTLLVLLGIAPGVVTVWWSAVVMRLLGRVREGVVPRASFAYARIWVKTGLLDRAGHWLSGTILWPVWLRCAGASIGPGSEVSTILDVVPEQLSLGSMTFLADGVYLGGPAVHRGTVRVARTALGSHVFIGNHAVIPNGERVEDGVLIGVSTVASPEMRRTGTSWFGHPPFALPRRVLDGWDRSVTHDPSWVRYLNRLFWEWLRFALPVIPLVVFGFWTRVVVAWASTWNVAAFVVAGLPAVTLGAGLALSGCVLVLKWLLLGRVSPGEHPLWSCWCSRWDFLYVAWAQLARPVLAPLEGTLLLTWYLRAMGARIGRRVALGDGFVQVVDPDMLEIDDDATVQAQFQAHTFEDRVLKIDRVRIHRGATVAAGVVLLSGSDLGPGTRVAAHSVVMKREHLRAGGTYAGCPVLKL